MKNQEQYKICSKHNRCEFLDQKFSKNTFICINRYCQHNFQLACTRCRNEFHRDHLPKFLSLETFKTLVDDLIIDDIKKSAQEGYDYYKRLNIIREFRRRMQVIEAQLTESIHEVITHSLGIDQELRQYKDVVEGHVDSLSNLESEGRVNQACISLKEIGSLVDYNVKKGMLEYHSPRLKELDEKVRRSLDKSSKEMEEMKEHTMKIIEVILHQLESDDEIELNLIKKKFKVYMESQKEKSVLGTEYKEIIDELVEEINKKSNELEGWLVKAQALDPKIRQQYNDSIFVKVYQIAEQNNEIHHQNQVLSKENEELKEELDDLRKKVARMNQRIREFKKALFEEDSKFKVLKGLYEKLTGKVYIVPECSINIDLLRAEALKLVSTSQQRLDILKRRSSKPQITSHGKHMLMDQEQPIFIPSAISQKVQCQQFPKQITVSQSRILSDQKKQQLITHMITIITDQQRSNQRWLSICQSKNQTIMSLKNKLKSLIDSSRAMILNQ